jgi:oxygen-independent coproporphyrinogen-3 oxidase
MLGLYLHVPFCSVRCSYCDFYLVAGRTRPIERFAAALAGEIAAVGRPLAGRPVDTVHFGGGTPSLLAPAEIGAILGVLRSVFAFEPGAEIALEANPEDLTPERAAGLAAQGVNRVSIGVQSLDDSLLRMLRRPHDAAAALGAVETARAAFPSLGVDLILGLPGQDPPAAVAAIDRLADRGVDHVSVYLLEIHAGTRLGREMALGRRHPMDDDAQARLYEAAALRLQERGYAQYEISNFARPGHRSRHNLKYWNDEDYLGFGPAAHSYIAGRRWSNRADLRGYLERGGVGIEREEDPRSPAARGAEALFSGLRLVEGVDPAALRARYGESILPAGSEALADLVAAGLLSSDDGRLRLTPRGRLVSNEVFERLLPPVS